MPSMIEHKKTKLTSGKLMWNAQSDAKLNQFLTGSNDKSSSDKDTFLLRGDNRSSDLSKSGMQGGASVLLDQSAVSMFSSGANFARQKDSKLSRMYQLYAS